MTVEIDYPEKPALIIPKKRSGGKKNGNAPAHVDHIIVVQGSSELTSAKMYSLAEAGGVIDPQKYNGNFVAKFNGYKNGHVANDLPIIPDGDEKAELEPERAELEQLNNAKNQAERPSCLPSKNHQFISNHGGSREIVDLSPIYENSSDACSSRDDIRSSCNDIAPKNFTLHDDVRDSNSATPNTLSQTHSEVSLEMGLPSDCQHSKNSMKKTKKRVNIVSEANAHDEPTEIQISGPKGDSEMSDSPEKSTTSNAADGYLTLNGTIKRGKKKGQNVNVTLNMSREELELLEANIVATEINKSQNGIKCSPSSGAHIFIWSLLCMPIVMMISSLYSFYMGTITWYNILVHVTEGKNVWVRVFGSPVVILSYPFLILSSTLGLGVYAGLVQVTCCGTSWWKEVCDMEKGFYGWLCATLRLSECSPYEVVILTDLKVIETTDMRGLSSAENVSI